MQNHQSVITQAVDGIGVKLAELYDLSVGRLYQILEADNYGKTKRLIRLIAVIDKERVKLIKADLDAFFAELLCDGKTAEPDCAELHSELNDVIQAKLKGLPRGERLKEVGKRERFWTLRSRLWKKRTLFTAIRSRD